MAAPNSLPQLLIGEREIDHFLDAAQESAVEVSLEVGCQDNDPFVLLNPLQKVVDFNVGVAVMGVLDLGPLAKKRVGFIEEKYGLALIRLPEDRAEIFLGFPDVFADHGGKVYLE